MDVNGDPLGKVEAAIYYHLITKLLYLYKRACPDIQRPISFLTTIVRSPGQHDRKKLVKTLQYLEFNNYLPLTFEDLSVQVVKWFVDAYFAVHSDRRIHSGGFVTFRKGCVYSTSVRQNLNTKRSAEAEMFGVSDILPQVIWTRYLLEAQE